MILCKLNENLISGNQNITFTNIRIPYGDYNITILSETAIKVNQLDFEIPFIYSDKQIINMNDDTKEYELKFKYDSYNENDLLYIHGTQYEYSFR